MSAAVLLERAKAAGITILVRDGSMKVIGQPDAIRPFLDDLRGSKAEILALLESEKTAANDAKAFTDQTADDPANTPPTPPTIDIGTRRPPGLTPALLAASLALDAQIAASGTQIDDPDRHCYPHSSAANTSELDLMGRRLERFARIGLPVDQAEKLADRLKDRDREHDDRRACVECSSLTGGTGGWSCMAFRARGARDPGLPRDLVGMLARCPVFVAGEPSGGVFTTARPANEPRLAQRDRTPGPWLTASESSAAQQYHQHHAQCPQCQAGGRGYSSRCSVGAALWNKYQQEGTTQ